MSEDTPRTVYVMLCDPHKTPIGRYYYFSTYQEGNGVSETLSEVRRGNAENSISLPNSRACDSECVNKIFEILPCFLRAIF